jgi:hypothetical protein
MAAKSIRRVVALALICWPIAATAQGGQAIEGAFGLVLGARFDRFGAGGGVGDDLMWFEVDQPMPVKAFDRIRAIVAPISYRIYGIRLEDDPQGRANCREKAGQIFAVVAEKYAGEEYGTRLSKDADGNAYQLEQKKTGRRINVRCGAAGELGVLYQDLALRDAAQAESNEWNRLTGAFQAGDAGSVPRLMELAAQGHMHAEFFVGYAYRRGIGVAPDEAQAKAYYTRAAGKGMVEAQYNLGTFALEHGQLQDAKGWLTKAAEKGMTVAQANLAQLYQRPGPLYDDSAAFMWFLKAAEGGHVDSQYNACHMYSAGDGVAKDDVAAWRWCDIAATSGHDVAARNRDFIAQRMTVAQLKQARDASQQWLATHRGK